MFASGQELSSFYQLNQPSLHRSRVAAERSSLLQALRTKVAAQRPVVAFRTRARRHAVARAA